jgi:hypothetical protein
MKISIDNNLISVKNILRSKGYELYDLSENVISDVYIYFEDNPGLVNLYKNIHGDINGSLIINAFGKTNDEILYSINNRVYSPLF